MPDSDANGKKPRPFYQTVVLTLITSMATGAGTYYAAKQDTAEPTHVAQQAVRVDMVWDMCRELYRSTDRRLTVLEEGLVLPGPMPLGESEATGHGPPPPVVLTPPDELFGGGGADAGVDVEDPLPPAPPPTASQPPTKRKRKSYPKRIPTPRADDPRVDAAQRALK